MLTAVGVLAERWVRARHPWTNIVGLARSGLAMATAMTLLLNRPGTLFRPLAGVPQAEFCEGLRAGSPFCVGGGHLALVRWLAVVGLLIVASGWRPRWTGILHWWITFGFQATAATLDGGDQIAGLLTLFLIPVTLTDDRRWHWAIRPIAPISLPESLKRVTAQSAMWMIRIQVAFIYFHAAVGKAYAGAWQQGTAMYYWLTNVDFGAPGWLAPLLRPILVNGTSVACLSYGIIVLEITLCAGLLLPRAFRRPLLVAGIAMHVGIIVVHGLVTFGLTMIMALILFLGETGRGLSFFGKTEARSTIQAAPSKRTGCLAEAIA